MRLFKSLALAAGALVLTIAAAAAQVPPAGDMQPPPPGVGAPPPPPPGGPMMAPDGGPGPEMGGRPPRGGGHGRTRALVEGCRAQARAQHLRGPGRRATIIACVRAVNPRAAASMVCKDKGRAQGLSGGALKAFARSCSR